MIEYLNRETVMKELDRNSITKKITLSDGVSIYDSIQKLPTADVVEVVRCKDCKHATFYACKNDACYRGIICEYRIGTDDENFFCIYGERREKEE